MVSVRLRSAASLVETCLPPRRASSFTSNALIAMDEDLIVVDDFEPNTPYEHNGIGAHPVASTSATALPGRPQRISARRRSTPAYTEHLEQRTTRSANKPRTAPKLKLKLSEKAASQAPGVSFLGPYDRELDSDDEELSFEEQFILRLPPGEDCEKLKKMVAAREVSPDVWFKFKGEDAFGIAPVEYMADGLCADSRRAVFHIGNNQYSAKLVDLPCIVEAQKTLDNKQMFKVADICQVTISSPYRIAFLTCPAQQMLLVENKIQSEDVFGGHKNFNIDDFIWPHGLTPPLHYVRKRRFRKRVNKRTIESVEQEVERLLEQDATASEVKYGMRHRCNMAHTCSSHVNADVLENVNPDLSDSEFVDRDIPQDVPTPGDFHSEQGDALTPAADGMAEGGEGTDEGDDDHEAEGDIDEELAAELDLALGDEGEDGDEEEEEEEDESEEDEDEDEDEDDERVQARQLLNEEINDLSAAVRKKEMEVASAGNPLIRKRFEDALKKLRADLDMKMAQKDEMKEMARRRKEGVVEGTAGEGTEGDGDDEADDEGDADGDMALEMEMQQALAAGPPEPAPEDIPEGPGDDGDLFGPEDEAVGMEIG
ncbi:hypothetical protein EVG20_g4060 [Dentipellis fragilis]|uniref:TAFII55 protein conserved region domain-containing protein n=1 Tax=Dentipellis fragilis TaxID=205917 RepID=A0A4Y9YZ91_9AGAM|nr:hypothetical protein EVG20_g4060 [Dentipellis fragilis]